MKRLSPGATGWVAVGAVVVLAELLDERTMSAAFLAASRHPVGRPVIFAAWGILTAHLFGVLPPEYDPIYLFGKHALAKVIAHGSRPQLDSGR
jgi:hypothetical protein